MTKSGRKYDAEVFVYALDVSRKAEVEVMTACALAQLGGIDVLINNVGICCEATLLEMSEEFFGMRRWQSTSKAISSSPRRSRGRW